jgi:hypothetical protein
MSHSFHRRRLLTGAAVGAPLAALGMAGSRQGLAQDALDDPLGLAAQVAAVDPAALFEALTTADVPQMTSENFTRFTAEEWPLEEFGPTGETALGGIIVYVEGATDIYDDVVLGGYLVFESAGAARAAFDTANRNASVDIQVPVVIAGLPGFTGVTGDSADTVTLVGNIVIFAGDAFFTDGARLFASDSVFRSNVHTVSLLDHLDSVTRPEATDEPTDDAGVAPAGEATPSD